MGEREFEVGSRKFKLSKIDAFKQFHIVRRIGPMLSELLPALKTFKQMKDFDSLPESDKLDLFAKLAAPLMTGLSNLSDSDADMVLFGLLASAEVQQSSGNWAYVANGKMLMIQDIDLPTMLQIAGRAFAYNLSGFFAGLPRQS